MANTTTHWWEPDKLIKDIIKKDIKESAHFAKGNLLDIGCGSKPYYEYFKNYVKSYIGLDINNQNAEIKSDIFKANLKSKFYDTVLCTQVLEHVDNPEKTLQIINRILKKGGVLILTAPLTGSLHEIPRDYYRYTKFGLKYLLEKTGFKIISIKEEGNWISTLSFNLCFYLESTLNRHLLRYPKKVMLIIIQFIFYLFSILPSRFTKPELFPINYIVIAKK